METTLNRGWTRCSKANPCPICGKDWCCIGHTYVNCMRIANDMPSKNGGWLYKLEGAKRVEMPIPEPPRPSINASGIMTQWMAHTTHEMVRDFGLHIGVGVEPLEMLNSAWSDLYRAWAFPMSDGYGDFVGIRLRDNLGKKWAVKGSHQGIFLPRCEPKARVYICEGPTDTAAALTLGLYAIGRPSCRGCEGPVQTALRRMDVREAVILADNDAPGQSGARALAATLHVKCLIQTVPAKDIREFLRLGGTKEMLEALQQGMVWLQPSNTH